jgi:hypothetical protein
MRRRWDFQSASHADHLPPIQSVEAAAVEV